MWMDAAEGAFERFLEDAPPIRRWYDREVRRQGVGSATRDVGRLMAFCEETRVPWKTLLTLEPTPLRVLIDGWASEKEGAGRDPSSVESVQELVRRFLRANGVRSALAKAPRPTGRRASG
jgi:hypothetical protein